MIHKTRLRTVFFLRVNNLLPQDYFQAIYVSYQVDWVVDWVDDIDCGVRIK